MQGRGAGAILSVLFRVVIESLRLLKRAAKQ